MMTWEEFTQAGEAAATISFTPSAMVFALIGGIYVLFYLKWSHRRDLVLALVYFAVAFSIFVYTYKELYHVRN